MVKVDMSKKWVVVNATLILEKEWEHRIPHKVEEVGLLRKARFAHMS